MAKEIDVRRLIEAVRKRPELWDPKHEHSKNRTLAHRSWEEVTQEINHDDVSLCKRKWRCIRDTYRGHVRRIIQQKLHGMTPAKVTWSHFKNLSFLKEYQRPRRTFLDTDISEDISSDYFDNTADDDDDDGKDNVQIISNEAVADDDEDIPVEEYLGIFTPYVQPAVNPSSYDVIKVEEPRVGTTGTTATEVYTISDDEEDVRVVDQAAAGVSLKDDILLDDLLAASDLQTASINGQIIWSNGQVAQLSAKNAERLSSAVMDKTADKGLIIASVASGGNDVRIFANDDMELEDYGSLMKSQRLTSGNLGIQMPSTDMATTSQGSTVATPRIEIPIQSTPEKTTPFPEPGPGDSDYDFLHSFLPYMKKMNEFENLRFRSQMCELLLTIKDPNGTESRPTASCNTVRSSAENVIINVATSTTSSDTG